MSRASSTWTDAMARRITRRVRRAARLSWLIALATVLGAGALVLAPRPVEGPDLVEIVGLAAIAPARATPPPAERSPVQVRLAGGVNPSRSPVEIRF